jgi:hypothetical protein
MAVTTVCHPKRAPPHLICKPASSRTIPAMVCLHLLLDRVGKKAVPGSSLKVLVPVLFPPTRCATPTPPNHDALNPILTLSHHLTSHGLHAACDSDRATGLLRAIRANPLKHTNRTLFQTSAASCRVLSVHRNGPTSGASAAFSLPVLDDGVERARDGTWQGAILLRWMRSMRAR